MVHQIVAVASAGWRWVRNALRLQEVAETKATKRGTRYQLTGRVHSFVQDPVD